MGYAKIKPLCFTRICGSPSKITVQKRGDKFCEKSCNYCQNFCQSVSMTSSEALKTRLSSFFLYAIFSKARCKAFFLSKFDFLKSGRFYQIVKFHSFVQAIQKCWAFFGSYSLDIGVKILYTCKCSRRDHKILCSAFLKSPDKQWDPSCSHAHNERHIIRNKMHPAIQNAAARST